ncbi:hypothetical protein Scep_006783 [Stephania cephalantha]|uniref:Uncharacterized protein n=1 Tax=Stephania cephalantha TaxID=152367 RepID=A0AAP0K8M0_9MAGN
MSTRHVARSGGGESGANHRNSGSLCGNASRGRSMEAVREERMAVCDVVCPHCSRWLVRTLWTNRQVTLGSCIFADR